MIKSHIDISDFITQSNDDLIMHRRWFHQHPEISYKEYQTSEYIQKNLTLLGINNISTIANTGVVCEIGSGDKVVACRFNMDGLPIREKTDLVFKSKFEGYSHSCGHDFELAWGLMIAKYFVTNPPKHKIKLLFQPAEESPGEDPQGRTGGQLYAEMGLFNVDAIFSLHVDPEIELGTVNIVDGDVTCTAYDFEYILQGVSCHAAKPHLGINPVYYASKLIADLYSLETEIKKSFKNDESFIVITPSILQTRISRDATILNESQNTIPEYVLLKGVSRIRSKEATQMLLNGLQELSKKHEELISLNLNLTKRAPATFNDKYLVGLVQDSCNENGIKLISKRTSWRDDAGWGAEKAPTAHGFIGIGGCTSLHSPQFNADEKGLEIGLTVFINSIYKLLNN